MVSLGAFYRPSVRRAAGLPPVWLGRARVAVPIAAAPIAERPELVLADWPDAPLPEEPVMVRRKTRKTKSHRSGGSGGKARPAIAQAAEFARSSETETLSAVTAGETAPGSEPMAKEITPQPAEQAEVEPAPAAESIISKFPAVEAKAARGDRKTRRSTRAVSSALRAPIDLRSVRSAMDERAIAGRAAVLAKARDEALQPRPEGLVPCKCGGRQNGQGAGLVPDWFGRDCIEADCPLRGSK